MLLPMRRLLVPVFAVSLMVGGLAYAAGDVSTSDEQSSGTQDAEQTLVTGDDVLETEADADDESEGGDPTGSSAVTSTGRSTEGCPDGFTGNHGQYVSSSEDHPRRDAAHSPCGKPLNAVHDEEPEEPATDALEAEDDGPGLRKGHAKDKGKDKKDH